MAPADPYLEGWRARSRAAEVRASAWRSERLAEATGVARALVERFGARRVLVFGSLARGSAGPDSDVDLWVEGLPEGAYLDAISLARQTILVAELDLVRAEWARASIRERALGEGIVLHAQ